MKNINKKILKMKKKVNKLKNIIKNKNNKINKFKKLNNDMNKKILQLNNKSNNNSKKAALLIGINYYNTKYELSGCINDIEKTKKVLIENYNFKEEDILVICDKVSSQKQPTKNNILEGFNWLINKNKNGYDKLWFHYSGHGSYSKDENNEEKDGYDECMCTSDDEYIKDDIINEMLLKQINDDSTLICFMDCCHSGTLLDLKYKYISGDKNEIENNNNNCNANVILISGCKDNQTSDDAYYNNEWSGAMTKFFLETIKKDNYNITCWNLLRKMRNELKNNNHTQIPQLTSSKKINSVTIFSSTNNDDNSFI